MTPSVVFGFIAIALFAILVGYIVPTLIQVRKTAQAAEVLLRGMGPRIESATSNLDAVLGRVDRVMKGMEDGTRGITRAMDGVHDLLSNLKPKSQGSSSGTVAAIGALLAGLCQAWVAFTAVRSKRAASPAGPEGGRKSE